MKKSELDQIYSRFYNSPAPIGMEDYRRFNKNLVNRKPSKSLGTVIFNNGTFVGSVKQTFKLRPNA